MFWEKLMKNILSNSDSSSAVAWVELLGGGQPLLENKRKTRDHAVNNWILGLLRGQMPPPAPPLPTGLDSSEAGSKMFKEECQIS